MDNTKSIEDIKKISIEARPELDSFLNCNPINPTIRKELEKQGVSVTEVTGTFSTRRSHVGGESHMFLKVDPENIHECTNPVIVDGALDQFCIDRFEAGEVFEQIGPKEDIPKVAVLQRKHELYQYYYEEETY